VLLLNRELLRKAEAANWTDELIRLRTDDLATVIVEIWRVPKGHRVPAGRRSDFSRLKARPRHKVHLSDLMNAGLLQPGMPLFPRRGKFADRVATLLPDGQVDVDGVAFTKPSGAAASITRKPTSGFSFFLVDQASRRSLRDVRRDYIDALAVDVEDDEADDEGDDDEA
jgi:hypothetical protein